MLLVLLSISLISQTGAPPVNNPNQEWVPYGFAALALSQLYQIIRALIKRYSNSAEARAEAAATNLEALHAREERLAKERSEKYREDNKIRDERLITVLQKIDSDGTKFIQALRETNERFLSITSEDRRNFVELINKVMDQSNYQTEQLTQLKTTIEALPDEFQSLKDDINKKLDDLTLHYELHHKEPQ